MSKEWTAAIHQALSYTLVAIIVMTVIGLSLYSIYLTFDFKSMWRKLLSKKDKNNDNSC